MSQKKQIPKFKNEEEERTFWDAHDSTEYVDWTKGKRVTLSSQKSSIFDKACVSGALSRNSVSSNLSYMRADIMSGQSSAYEHRSQNLTMMTFETTLRLNDMRIQGLKKFSKGISIWKELQEKFSESEFSQISIEMTEKFNNEIVAMGALSTAIDLSAKRKEVKVDLEEPKQSERIIEVENFNRLIELYDTAIQNTPGTSYANMAYKMKMQTLLGWKKTSNRGMTIHDNYCRTR